MASRARSGRWALEGLVLLLGAAVSTAPAQIPDTAALERLVREADGLGVRTGILVRDGTGEAPLFTRRALDAFVPASNMKVISAAAAIAGLGGDYRFRTRFELAAGVLRVRAGGDPNWRTGAAADPAALLDRALAALRQAGIGAIRGIALDEGPYTGPRRPAGWPADQLEYYYCAPTGGLVLEEGCFRVELRAAGGRSARVTLLAPPAAVPLSGRIGLTGNRREGSRYGVRDDGRGLQLFGRFYRRAPPAVVLGAVRDPAAWFEAAMTAALERAGIRLDPSAPPHDHEPVVIETDLQPALERALVHSSNFAAEQLGRVLGAELLGDGSLQGGSRATVRQLRAMVGNLPAGTRLADASGLSRDNRLSPALVVATLREALARHPELIEALATPDGPGTLGSRFAGSPVAGRVRAKTGWIRGASALSGVLRTRSGHHRVFSILMNYDPDRAGLNRQLKELQERMVEAMDRIAPERIGGRSP